ncbi:MAG: AAA family ATPase [Euryarchaeota archaeon]|nr:AAA family ATPase [Euryarchaeota archaeon]
MSQDIKCISFVNPKGKKVLIVDFDPRANATLALGIDSSALKKSIYDVVLSCCGYNQNTQNSSFILKQMISDIYINRPAIERGSVDVQQAVRRRTCSTRLTIFST